MERYIFYIQKRALVIEDNINKGSLHIVFNRITKPAISPLFEAWNDIEVAILNNKLSLNLYGVNFIQGYNDFLLSGDVTLKSSHLYDPIIQNGTVSFCRVSPKLILKESSLKNVGLTHFGTVKIENSDFHQTPFRKNDHYSHFVDNKLVNGG